MSFVNEAYRTLRDSASVRDYILKLHGLKIEGARSQIPMELAEGWFELQDTIAENPSQAAEKISTFKIGLEQFRAGVDQKMKSLEAALDRHDPLSIAYRGDLEKLSRLIQEYSYLKSLARDVERMGSHA